uniref:Sterile alpha motif domain containing 13 n=1 Tax=Ailuropoda melanoleuca TaxID=9646 RepID=A0A7N5K297_AILME
MVMVLRGKLGSGPLREETAVVLASCPGPAPRRLSSEPGHTLLHTPPQQVSGFVFCSSMENGRPPDPADWAVMDVVNYFRTAGFEEQASAFQEQEIDGKSLLLMTRNDVLTGLQLKLGPALKIYEYHVKPLQTKHLKNNSS